MSISGRYTCPDTRNKTKIKKIKVKFTKSKKLLSILLVLSLAMCIFPASAFAEEVSSATAVDSVDYATAYGITLWNHTDVVLEMLHL